MIAVAEAAAARRKEGESALAILDEAADRSDIRGADAEFDDAPYREGLFRSLLVEAFGHGLTFTDDEDGDEFYERVWRPFSQRYGLC